MKNSEPWPEDNLFNKKQQEWEDVPVVEVKGLSKRYGFIWALKDVGLQIERGKIFGLVGDNGAGKSTLVKILSGIIEPTSGQLFIDGKEQVLTSPLKARKLGIESFQQNLVVGEEQSVAANVFLGREPYRKFLGCVRILSSKQMYRQAKDMMGRLNIDVNVRKPMKLLSGGERQAACIVRALLFNPKVLIFDEPTTMLSVAAIDKLKGLLVELRREEIGILVISHDLNLILDITDYIIVLYHGKVNFKGFPYDLTRDELVGKMLMPCPVKSDL